MQQNTFLNEEELIVLKKPKHSASNSYLLKKNENLETNQRNLFTQMDYINSADRPIKTKTFLDNTFNTKIAKKLTLETQKSLKDKRKAPLPKGAIPNGKLFEVFISYFF